VKSLITVAGIAAFLAVLYWMTLQQGGIRCEVCMARNGRVHCATVVASSRDEAVEQGRNSACGVLTQGMANELQCQRSALQSLSCEE